MPKAPGTITFKPIGWDELGEKFGASREVILRGMNSAFRRMSKHMVPALKEYTPEGASSRHMKGKTVGEILGQAEDMRLEIRQSAWNGSYPYGVGVRMGTRPHWPPYRALIPWVSLKWGGTDKEVRQSAFFLARKISRVGTKPNDYHVRCLEANKDTLIDIEKEEIVKAAESLGQEVSFG